MKAHRQPSSGMSLVEVAISIGIIAFCAVALMGLLPVMFNTTLESRETTVAARIHQTVASDLRENYDGTSNSWYFNQDGLRVSNSDGADYSAIANAASAAQLSGVTSSHALMIPVVIQSIARGETILTRPVFINHAPLQSP